MLGNSLNVKCFSKNKNKKRWQEYTEELHKKDLHDPDNHNYVITNLEPNILECEVKDALKEVSVGLKKHH